MDSEAASVVMYDHKRSWWVMREMRSNGSGLVVEDLKLKVHTHLYILQLLQCGKSQLVKLVTKFWLHVIIETWYDGIMSSQLTLFGWLVSHALRGSEYSFT